MCLLLGLFALQEIIQDSLAREEQLRVQSVMLRTFMHKKKVILIVLREAHPVSAGTTQRLPTGTRATSTAAGD